MRLFRLTVATIFQRKAWAICVLAIIALPFALPYISSATEKPVLVQPARVQAAWSTLWVCGLIWGFFTAAREGESNARSGIGEYFQTTGVGPTRQLFEIWLAIISFIIPMAILTALICQFAARPSNPDEQSMWWILNAQYTCLFVLVIAPLLVLATAVASRFGSISGFCISILLTLYGLYGVGYLDSMLKIEENPLFKGILYFSPQYRFADLTQRLYFKSGALTADTFITMLCYFGGICLIYAAISRICFRAKSNS